MDDIEAAIDGYFKVQGAKTAPSISEFGRFMSRALVAMMVLAGALAVWLFLRDGIFPLVPAVVFAGLCLAAVVALSARKDSKEFGEGLFVLVKEDTFEAMKAFAAAHPEKSQVLPLDRRGDGKWAPVALVRLNEIGAQGFAPIDYDFYAPRPRRGKPAAPRMGPGGQPVCLLVIHGLRHSYDYDLSAAADIIHARTVVAVRT